MLPYTQKNQVLSPAVMEEELQGSVGKLSITGLGGSIYKDNKWSN